MAKVVQAAASYGPCAFTVADAPGSSVKVDAEELEHHHSTPIADYEHANPSRQACGARSKHWLAVGPAAAQRRSSGCSWRPGKQLLLNAFDS